MKHFSVTTKWCPTTELTLRLENYVLETRYQILGGDLAYERVCEGFIEHRT